MLMMGHEHMPKVKEKGYKPIEEIVIRKQPAKAAHAVAKEISPVREGLTLCKLMVKHTCDQRSG
jgi:hypothetical protein